MTPNPMKTLAQCLEGRWVKYQGSKALKIRPVLRPDLIKQVKVVSASPGPEISDEIAKQIMFQVFRLALVDWKDVVSIEGKSIPLNEETKRLIFFGEAPTLRGLRDFVISESLKMLGKVPERMEELTDRAVEQIEKVKEGGGNEQGSSDR